MSSTFSSTLLHALKEERHFALLVGLRFPTWEPTLFMESLHSYSQNLSGPSAWFAGLKALETVLQIDLCGPLVVNRLLRRACAIVKG